MSLISLGCGREGKGGGKEGRRDEMIGQPYPHKPRSGKQHHDSRDTHAWGTPPVIVSTLCLHASHRPINIIVIHSSNPSCPSTPPPRPPKAPPLHVPWFLSKGC